MGRVHRRGSAGADETIAELETIVGFDDDLAGEATRAANGLHGLLTQIHSSLERVLEPRMQRPAVLTLLERFGSPAQICKAGRRRLVTLLRPRAPRTAERPVEDVVGALDEQTVTVPGTEAAALIVPGSAGSLAAVLDQRRLLAGRIEELLEAHPLSKVLTSMPGIGVRTGARIAEESGLRASRTAAMEGFECGFQPPDAPTAANRLHTCAANPSDLKRRQQRRLASVEFAARLSARRRARTTLLHTAHLSVGPHMLHRNDHAGPGEGAACSRDC